MAGPGLNEITTTTLRNREMDDKKTYEGSHEDYMADYNAAKRKGITTEQYEDSAEDRIADAAGERRLKGESSEQSEIKPDNAYKQGIHASGNPPKTSSGFGHSSREGNLRNSGHRGAHRIGRKKG